MESQSNILIVLAATLVAAKLVGHFGQRVGLPTAVGKIGAGLIIGPAVLGFASDDAVFRVLAEVGVVILMFMVGMETDLAMMRRVSVPAFAVAAGGVLLPFLGGVGVGYAFGLEPAETLFLGAILTATSVSISAQTLRELGLLQSREGTTILAAAVIDDVMGVIVLSFVFAMTGEGDPVVSIAKMVVFLPAAFIAGYVLSGPLARRIETHLSVEGQLSLVIAAALAYAWAADRLGGVAAVTGAYLAGLLISRTNLAPAVSQGLNWVGYSLFVPLFFVSIGMQADFSSLAAAPALAAALLGVAIVAKIVGCYGAARLTRSNHRQALTIGVGMMSRGEVALVIASAGLSAGAIGGTVFSAAILMTLVTTVLTPVLLKLVNARESASVTSYELGEAQAESALA